MRIEAEHRTTAQLGRALLHDPDVEVAVLDGPREVPVLKRRPHRRVLVRRHAAPEHQRFGTATDARAQRSYQHVFLAELGQRGRPDLAVSGRAQPERVGLETYVLHETIASLPVRGWSLS